MGVIAAPSSPCVCVCAGVSQHSTAQIVILNIHSKTLEESIAAGERVECAIRQANRGDRKVHYTHTMQGHESDERQQGGEVAEHKAKVGQFNGSISTLAARENCQNQFRNQCQGNERLLGSRGNPQQ